MDLTSVYRAEYGRCVATLTRLLGDIGLAEEAVQDAFAMAVQKWHEAPPDNPGAWIVTTARNRATDRLRRESTREARHAQALLLHELAGMTPLDVLRAGSWGAGEWLGFPGLVEGGLRFDPARAFDRASAPVLGDRRPLLFQLRDRSPAVGRFKNDGGRDQRHAQRRDAPR